MNALNYLIVAIAGVSFVFQQAVNSNLRVEISSPWWAGFISYLGGTIVMLLAALALREPLSFASASATSAMSWTGGIFGAIYIAISILMLPKLGAATVLALLVAGQMIGSIVFDHYGLLGVPVHSITLSRILGALLLMAGVLLIRR
jgi:bacterial/archaeal transporter family-2 protein